MAKEIAIQRDIYDWLQRQGYLFWRTQATTVRGRKRGKWNLVGLPDIFVLVGGVLVGIEVKTPIGVISKAQMAFGDDLERNGGRYFIVRSVADVQDAFKYNGIA